MSELWDLIRGQPWWLPASGLAALVLLVVYLVLRVRRGIDEARDYREIAALVQGERSVPADVMALIVEGDGPGAIDRLRRQYGIGLESATRAVTLTQQTLAALAEVETEMAEIHPDHLSGRLLHLLRAGKRAEAVRRYAQAQELPIKEAEAIVAAFEADLRAQGLI